MKSVEFRSFLPTSANNQNDVAGRGPRRDPKGILRMDLRCVGGSRTGISLGEFRVLDFELNEI